METDVALTPYDLERREPSGLSVVIDVLRASSTIVTALQNGCEAMYPVSEPSEAFPLADGTAILSCGERKGVKIRGYHIGNSPAEFSKEAVSGKRLVMCTTNGTRAIRAAAGYGRTFIGCFLNAPAVASRLTEVGEDVTIICAGREGSFSIEDALCAGMIISELDGEMTDAAVASATMYEAYQDRIGEVLEESEHGRFLQRIGFADDIVYCSRAGVADIVPEVFPSGKPAPHDLIIRTAPIRETAHGGSND
jgi:2-phosphosulfolactate phosphatase